MKEASDIAKVAAKEGFHVLWGFVVSTVISAVGSIFIARLLGSDLYGLYAVALTVPTLLAVFRDWGINSAIIRSTAQFGAENKAGEIRGIILSGFIFEIALGGILAVTSIFFSDFIATSIFSRPNLIPLVQIASLAVLVDGLSIAANATFIGTEKMKLNSLMTITGSIFKTAIAITLVVFGLGTRGAIIGHVAGVAIASMIGIILVWTVYRYLPRPNRAKLQLKSYIGPMLRYSGPLSLSNILVGFQIQFYNFLLPIYYTIDNAIIGNYSVASNFAVLIAFFSVPITTMLFPAFSKLKAQNEKETLQKTYQYSVKYASLLVIPVASLIMSLAEPAVYTLFGNTYSAAPLFLALLSFSNMYVALGSLSNINLINSQGDTKYALLITLVTAIIGFPLALALILNWGVLGLLATSLIVGIPNLVLGLHIVRRQYGVVLDWKASARILSASAISAIVTFVVTYHLGFASWIRLIIGVIVFVAVLVPAIVLTRAISDLDISNLREMTRGLGPITTLSEAILKALETTMDLFKI